MTAPEPWLSPHEVLALHQIGGWLGESWSRTARRRRLFFLVLAAPGFFAVFATPLHHSLWVLGSGALLFAAACIFRARTEPLFVRAEAGALWPLPHPQEVPRA